MSDWAGAFSGEATPVPIPNTEVKLLSGDDTPLGESSTVPDLSLRPSYLAKVFLCLSVWSRHKQFDVHRLI